MYNHGRPNGKGSVALNARMAVDSRTRAGQHFESGNSNSAGQNETVAIMDPG